MANDDRPQPERDPDPPTSDLDATMDLGHTQADSAGAPSPSPSPSPRPPVARATPPSSPRSVAGTRPGTVPGARGPDAPAVLQPGEVLGDRYRVVASIGAGGMGQVYRVDDLTLGNSLAIKVLPPEVADDPVRLERFRAEVRLAREITHRNVCRVHDIVESDGLVFLTMEHVDGEDLSTLRRRIGRLPPERAAEVARELCLALNAVHERGILHRDLKPANVMLDGRGSVRLTDFGIAADGGSDAAEFVGTPAYMSPERLDGADATRRSDLYALGLVLYELFTGRPVHDAATIAELKALHRSGTALSRPSTSLDDMDPRVEAVIMRCLEPNPAERPASAAQVMAALPGGDPLAAVLAAGDTPSPELLAAAGERRGMSPVRAVVLGLIGIVLVMTAAIVGGQRSLLRLLPMERPPEVLLDRARTVIERFGYDRPVDIAPRDQGYGFFGNQFPYQWLSSPERDLTDDERRELLQSDRLNVLSFMYRQAGLRTFVPRGSDSMVATHRVLGPADPPDQAPGDIYVSTDLAGRLRVFYAYPSFWKRDADVVAAEGPPDWSVAFELAELDINDFEPVEPRMERHFAPEHAAAFVGTLPDLPDLPVQIEVGSTDGRISQFIILWPWTVSALTESIDAAEPMPAWRPSQVVSMLIGASMTVLAAWLGLRNLAQGRADRRGAIRLAVVLFVLYFVAAALRTHAPLREGPADLGPAAFFAVACWLAYLVVEPFARRVWPELLISWSRLVIRPTRSWRDPVLGRAVLFGVVAGGALMAAAALVPLATSAIFGFDLLPRLPGTNLQHALHGLPATISVLVSSALVATLAGVSLTFGLVLARRLLQWQWAAIAAVILVASAPQIIEWISDPSSFEFDQAFSVLVIGAVAVLLLRVGLLSVVIALAMLGVFTVVASFAPGTWWGVPSVTGLVSIGGLLAYGLWAAIEPGGSRVGLAPAAAPGASPIA